MELSSKNTLHLYILETNSGHLGIHACVTLIGIYHSTCHAPCQSRLHSLPMQCASYILCWVRLILHVSVRHSNISIIVGNLLLLQVDSAELRLGDGDEGIVDDKAVLPSIWSAEYLYTLV